MSFAAVFEENKVQAALKKLRENPDINIATAARECRALYDRVYRRYNRGNLLNSRRGYSQKLVKLKIQLLKIIFSFTITSVETRKCYIIAYANRLLIQEGRVDSKGDIITVSRRQAERWIKRYSKWLKTLKSKPLSFVRRNAYNRQDIIEYFVDFKRYREKWGIVDDDIYNFDETGCQIGLTTRNRVVVLQGLDKIFVNNPDNKELVTCIKCFSTTGYYVLQMLIFKGAYYLRKYFDNDIDGNTLFVRLETGYTNDILTLAQVKYFEKLIRPPIVGVYRILIFNSYSSYIIQDFLDFY